MSPSPDSEESAGAEDDRERARSLLERAHETDAVDFETADRLLDAGSRDTRDLVVRALALVGRETGSRTAVHRLAAVAADDADEAIRVLAATALAEVGDAHPEAVTVATPALRTCFDGTPMAKVHALHAFARGASETPAIAAAAAHRLRDLLEDDIAPVRTHVAIALEHAATVAPDRVAPAVPVLARLLSESRTRMDPDTYVRDTPHGEDLRRALRDKEHEADTEHDTARVAAGRALAAVAAARPDDVVGELDTVTTGLTVEDPDVRRTATAVLARVAAERPAAIRTHVSSLGSLVRSEDETAVRGVALWALSLAVDADADAVVAEVESAVDAVRSHLTDERPVVRAAAANLLAELSDAGVDVENAAADLESLRSDPVEHVRATAVLALDAVGSEAALVALRGIREEDASSEVRELAAAALDDSTESRA